MNIYFFSISIYRFNQTSQNKEKQENMQQALKYGPAALDQDKPDGDEDGDAE